MKLLWHVLVGTFFGFLFDLWQIKLMIPFSYSLLGVLLSNLNPTPRAKQLRQERREHIESIKDADFRDFMRSSYRHNSWCVNGVSFLVQLILCGVGVAIGSRIKGLYPTSSLIVIGVILVLLVALPLGLHYLFRVRKSAAKMHAIERAALAVRIAAFSRLEQRYRAQWGDEAGPLAVAVTDELFSDLPSPDSPAAHFIARHPDVVSKYLRDLADDTELLTITYHTLHASIPVMWANGIPAEQVLDPMNKMTQLGLNVDVAPISDEEFLRLAEDFHKANTAP